MLSLSQSWVEKYRPQTMSQIYSQDHIINILEKSIKDGTVPHLLFYGPPGTGKTSTIMALARSMYGDHVNDSILVMNASDERGIGVVRNKIKSFAQTSVVHNDQTASYPSFKLIILDEADSMTTDAQAALRRIIEDYSHITRFCMICNYVSKIIDPLISRCFKFYFKPITDHNVNMILRKICDSEQINIPGETLETICELSVGDLRRAISLMEVSYKVYGNNISVKIVEDYAGFCPDIIVSKLFEAIKSCELDRLHVTVNEITNDAYPVWSILQKLSEIVIRSSRSEHYKAKVCWMISKVSESLNCGADEYLQILYISMYMMKMIQIENGSI